MTALIINVLAFLLVAWIVWHKLGDPVEDPEAIKVPAEEHHRRVEELRRAYEIVKDELGEEPNIDQIFLTRDQLRTHDALEDADGTTG